MKLIIPILFTIFGAGCQQSGKETVTALNKYYFEGESKIIYLPGKLKEVSGLAAIDADYILAHNDEKGVVSKIQISTGKILVEYSVGKKELKEDFEGIALVNDSVYLITSNGLLYKFLIDDTDDETSYKKIQTSLTSEYNVEGMCFDKITNSLLLACKEYPGRNHKKFKAIYKFNPVEMKLNNEPEFLISLEQLKEQFGINDFSPSGIEVNPLNGNFFIISANPEVIIETDRQGNIIDAVTLDNKKHDQPEGITFLPDGTMILADESNSRKARLTFIPFRK